ncbi:metallophosphoesterase [Virgibacillus doumboii]|uniref:metallophosphoesterase n=1 Tax=Virgibacillus doumboii TaxID=2697503 RepID=UPI0013E0452D|nr:metallophosphoesterase [Virgibacillus doumboii]
MEKIKQLSVPNNARIIVINDIHGELDLFINLLEKVNFNTEDYLIINGDLCEKGGNSIGVVNYIMNLAATNPGVHVTEGNCEALVEELINENPQVIDYLRVKKHSILNEWLEQLGSPVYEETSIHEVKEILTKHFSKEIKWLANLPTAIETDDYTFVHAGLEDIADWKDTDRDIALTLPSFLEKSHRADKYVVVGHWPVVNYSLNLPSNNPIIDHEKRIIATDGGNVIKSTGQLNAFIIYKDASKDRFTHTYVDQLPTGKIVKDFRADSTMAGSVAYPHYEIDPIEKGDHFTLCKQLQTGHKRYVKNEYVKQNEDGKFTVKNDIPCTQLSVNKGDVVSVVDNSCTGYSLIKKDGKEGWVAKGSLE